METGKRGTYLIAWLQSEVDGLIGGPLSSISIGSTWRWTGSATRIDDERDILLLENATDVVDMRRRAAGSVRRMLGTHSINFGSIDDRGAEDPLFRSGFRVTDGHESYQITLITTDSADWPMLLFMGRPPSPDSDLWVVSCDFDWDEQAKAASTSAVCFVPDTSIKTPQGGKLVQDLCEGDLICTKDNGPQIIRWIGNRSINGGRLLAMPHLRPVRLRANVFSEGAPDRDLIVSPDHRILVKGAVAKKLFNTTEVLVAARDLINDRTIRVDRQIAAVEYVHIMLDSHQIVWANGVATESFHPAQTSLDQVEPPQRRALFERFPEISRDAHAYGSFARRNLTCAEAAILSYGATRWH